MKKNNGKLHALLSLVLTIALCLGCIAGGIVVQAAENWKSNVMTNDIVDAFGLKRAQVRSVTFLDSLEDVPANAWNMGKGASARVKGWLEWEDSRINIYLAAEGGINGTDHAKKLFADFTNLEEVSFGGAFHTEDAASLEGMFDGCEKLEAVDTETLNTAKVKTTRNMFRDCSSLEELDISTWDTGKLTRVTGMFKNCVNLDAVHGLDLLPEIPEISKGVPAPAGKGGSVQNNKPVTPHTHVPGEWVVKQEPYDNQPGQREQLCAQCGETVASEAYRVDTMVKNNLIALTPQQFCDRFNNISRDMDLELVMELDTYKKEETEVLAGFITDDGEDCGVVLFLEDIPSIIKDRNSEKVYAIRVSAEPTPLVTALLTVDPVAELEDCVDIIYQAIVAHESGNKDPLMFMASRLFIEIEVDNGVYLTVCPDGQTEAESAANSTNGSVSGKQTAEDIRRSFSEMYENIPDHLKDQLSEGASLYLNRETGTYTAIREKVIEGETLYEVDLADYGKNNLLTAITYDDVYQNGSSVAVVKFPWKVENCIGYSMPVKISTVGDIQGDWYTAAVGDGKYYVTKKHQYDWSEQQDIWIVLPEPKTIDGASVFPVEPMDAEDGFYSYTYNELKLYFPDMDAATAFLQDNKI